MKPLKLSADVLIARIVEFLLSPRGRTLAYACAVTALAATLMFWRLGASAMTGDEATYAMEADTMWTSGNWLDVLYTPNRPMYQKPPLYLWLSGLSRELLGDSEIAYRAASAGFGTASVALSVLLGGVMFGPEIGLLAGLILLTNANYLFNHGARTGTFDTGLSFCFVLATLLVWRARKIHSSFLPWVAMGALVGFACLLKPFAGIPMLALLGIVALMSEAEVKLRDRVIGLAIALGAMLLVALPWYIAQIVRHGGIFFEVIFWENLVARSFRGLDARAVSGWRFYWSAITGSSAFFRLFIPALIFCAAMFIHRRARSEYRAVFLLAAGWVAIFSISVSKFVHYAYPAFPMIAIAIAVLLVAIADAVARRLGEAASGKLARATIIAGFTVVMVCSILQILISRVEDSVQLYRPWEAFKVLQPAIATGRARLALVGFPDDPGQWWPEADIRSSDHFYLKRMQPAVRIDNQAALDQLLGQHVPTLLLACRSSALARKIDLTEIRGRLDERFCCEESGVVMCGLDLVPLFHASIHDASAPAVLSRIRSPNAAQRGDEAFVESFSVSLDSPIAAPAWVSAHVLVDAPSQATPLLFTATVDGSSAAYSIMPPSSGDRELTIHLQTKSVKPHRPATVTFQLAPMDGGIQTIIGTVRDITFDAYPSPPASRDE